MAGFMSELLEGLDDSFWTAVPSPDPSPVKQKNPFPPATPCTPTKPRQPATVTAFALFFERVSLAFHIGFTYICTRTIYALCG
jgi:hypothetical protein